MRRLILLSFALFFCIAAEAQFRPYRYSRDIYSDAYDVASAIARADENYRLGNTRFDENALMQNPQAWAAYEQYLRINSRHYRQYRNYKIASWVGLGVAAAGVVPMFIGIGMDDIGKTSAATAIGISMSCAGALTSLVGCIGLGVQSGKLKANKKEFIFYLTTNNNGVGIVTLF